MQTESACGFASAVKTRDDVAIQIHHLALRIDPETRARVVDYGRSPSRVEWGGLNLKFGRRCPEVGVLAGVHKRVVPGHRIFQCSGGLGLPLVLVYNLGG